MSMHHQAQVETIGYPDLCERFVCQMVDRGTQAHARLFPGSAPVNVDWDAIWRAGEGASSSEEAAGRVVREAYEQLRSQGAGLVTLDELDRLLFERTANPPVDDEWYSVRGSDQHLFSDLPSVVVHEEIEGREVFTWVRGDVARNSGNPTEGAFRT